MSNFLELVSAPFSAGEVRNFELAGDYFEIIDSVFPVDIILSDRNGAQRGRLRSADASFHIRNTPFSSISIASSSAQTIRFGFGSGEAGTRRTSGVVQVVDGGRFTSVSGAAFLGAGYATALAGQVFAIALWNPPASTRMLRLKKIRFETTASGAVAIITRSIAAAFGASAAPSNKLIGGPVAQALILSLSNGGAIPPNSDFYGLDLLLGAPKSIDFQEPILIPAGRGLMVSCNVALPSNADISGNFEFVEDAV